MAKRHEVFPSRYLKEADLGGKPLEVEIERAPQEELGSGDDKDEKTVLYFRGMSKVFPLNITNWDSVADIAGEDTLDWPGAYIELYPSTTPLKGKVVPCIRIRAPRQRELLQKKPPQPRQKETLKKKLDAITASAAIKNDMDDDIPFKRPD